MKATDLQLGDWVAIGSECFKHYGMVRSVDAANVYAISWVTKNTERHPIFALDPVPLTPEILEKNGWEKAIGENPAEVWTIKKGVYLHNTDNGYKLREGAEFNVPNIKYVHTLQNALRLCGLDELADNFKID